MITKPPGTGSITATASSFEPTCTTSASVDVTPSLDCHPFLVLPWTSMCGRNVVGYTMKKLIFTHKTTESTKMQGIGVRDSGFGIRSLAFEGRCGWRHTALTITITPNLDSIPTFVIFVSFCGIPFRIGTFLQQKITKTWDSGNHGLTLNRRFQCRLPFSTIGS